LQGVNVSTPARTTKYAVSYKLNGEQMHGQSGDEITDVKVSKAL
jgi:hypothetical protein